MDKEMIKRRIGILVSMLVKNYAVRGLDVQVHGENLAERVIDEAAKDVAAGDFDFSRTVVLIANDIKRIDALQGQGKTAEGRQYASLKDIPDDVFARSLTQASGPAGFESHDAVINSERSAAAGGSGQRESSFDKRYASMNDIPDDVFANSFKSGGSSIMG